MAARKLILVDGNSLLYRAFFALPAELATTAGVPTNAVYGFATMLVRLLLDERPDCILVAWERGETFRHAEFAEYKAGRPATPDALSVQAPLARAVQEALRIPAVEAPGFEADDVVATLARRGAEQGYDVLIVYAVVGATTLVLASRGNARRPVALGFAICVWSTPATAYTAYIATASPIWRGVLAQYGNAGVYTPAPAHLLVLLGLPLGRLCFAMLNTIRQTS